MRPANHKIPIFVNENFNLIFIYKWKKGKPIKLKWFKPLEFSTVRCPVCQLQVRKMLQRFGQHFNNLQWWQRPEAEECLLHIFSSFYDFFYGVILKLLIFIKMSSLLACNLSTIWPIEFQARNFEPAALIGDSTKPAWH